MLPMSGLLALLDDVAAITKVAAASADDVAGQAAKAGAKAAGAVIDDTAVAPQYVSGIDASRELPIVWKIARGSILNKLVVLLPAALLLSAFAPWAITPLLMLGGAYLGYEGAEKIHHLLFPPRDHGKPAPAAGDPAHLEREKVAGAIKTDFILSAEIMTIALSAIPQSVLWQEALVLAVVAIGITALVYGSVALIVRADDLGLWMARNGRRAFTRRAGCAILRFMPRFMQALTTVGTAAMLWVGGSILLHGLEAIGLAAPAHLVENWAEAVGHAAPVAGDLVAWLTRAGLDALVGLATGLVLLPVASWLIAPLWSRLFGKESQQPHA